MERTLIIGLDGATFDIINPLVKAGYLPTMAKLINRGIHGDLQSWPNMNSASAWSSMVTGYNPGQHGIYNSGWDVLPRSGHKRLTTSAADRRKDPFWRFFGATGQRAGIVNIPITYPADPINGFMLAGMDTPNLHCPGFAYPPSLLKELSHKGIDYVIDIPNIGALINRNPHIALQSLQRMVDVHSHTILHLMRTHPWDVLMAVLVATDRVQHYFWPDEHVSVENPDWAPIRTIYQQIDSFLHDTLAIIDENTTVLVVSDHGSGPIRYGMSCLNQLFSQLGLLQYRQGRGRLKGQLLKNLLLYGRKIIPLSLQDPLARALPELHIRAVSEHRFSSIEWFRTQVFACPQGQEVYINLKGRMPEGTVSLDDYFPLLQRVQDILMSLTDPATGKHVIRAVHHREDIYSGPYVDKAPDLLIEWDYEVAQDALCYTADKVPIIIQPSRVGPVERLTGTHRPHGIFISFGQHIKQDVKIEKVTIYDIVPTILYMQGHPIPSDMEGKVLTDIFTDEILCDYPL